ncbi:MAG: hypothetical protein DRG82_16160 [Deltaproteobacteria bacterium]|nr:MAG: hypothetical protein DRG82_16160 [Deltaproteobacteria bacterium]
MEIVCPACGKVYQIRDEQLSGTVRKARCKSCGRVFPIQKDPSQNKDPEEKDASFAFHESEPQGHAAPGPSEPPLPEDSSNTEEVETPADTDAPTVSDDQIEGPEPQAEQGRRDYAAILVLLAAIVALVVVSFLGIRNIDRDSVFRPLRSISRLTGFFEGKHTRSARKAHLKKGRQNTAYQEHLSRGHGYYRAKKYNAAIKEYTLAVRSDPGRYEAYYWRGQLFGLRKEYPRTIKDMHRVLRLNPAYTKAHRSLGWAYYEMGKYDEAIKALDRYIRSNPKDGWAFYERALAYHKKGKLEPALKDAKRACDLGFKRGCDVYKRYK